MTHDSPQSISLAVPDEIRTWNWGAFLLAPVWGIGNRVYIGLLALVPLLGLIIAILLGMRGNEWAWPKRRWENPQTFLRLQRKWSYWGVGLFVLLSLLYIVLNWAIQGLWVLLYIVFIATLFDSIFSRAGYRYSGGMSLLMLVPGPNVVMFLIFAAQEWPVQRQVRDLRIRCGSADEEDANSLLAEAVRLEVRGTVDKALLKYQEVVVRCRGTVAANDAAKCIAALGAKSEAAVEPSS